MYLLEKESNKFINTFETVKELEDVLNKYLLVTIGEPLSNITIKKHSEIKYHYSEFAYYKKNVALYPETTHFMIFFDHNIILYEQIEDRGWIRSEFTIKKIYTFYIKYPYEYLNINKPLGSNTFDKIKHIQTNNEKIWLIYYKNIESLCFWDNKNPIINKNKLPHVKTLELIRYNHDLSPGIIPDSVENLTMTVFNKPIKKGDLPDSIKILQLGVFFEQIIEKNTLPKSLRILYLPNDYIHKDKLDHIPESVTIQFGSLDVSTKKGRMNYTLYDFIKNKNKLQNSDIDKVNYIPAHSSKQKLPTNIDLEKGAHIGIIDSRIRKVCIPKDHIE